MKDCPPEDEYDYALAWFDADHCGPRFETPWWYSRPLDYVRSSYFRPTSISPWRPSAAGLRAKCYHGGLLLYAEAYGMLTVDDKAVLTQLRRAHAEYKPAEVIHREVSAESHLSVFASRLTY